MKDIDSNFWMFLGYTFGFAILTVLSIVVIYPGDNETNVDYEDMSVGCVISRFYRLKSSDTFSVNNESFSSTILFQSLVFGTSVERRIF
uniref:Transmembrane protein n=2 Tax=Caenorhabditis tropicalis TaxID=1561998 RepID=A0A1I7UGJ3_9PELO